MPAYQADTVHVSFTDKTCLDLNVGWAEPLSSSPGEIVSMGIAEVSCAFRRQAIRANQSTALGCLGL